MADHYKLTCDKTEINAVYGDKTGNRARISLTYDQVISVSFARCEERKLFKNELLLGKDKKPEDCLDEDGYVSYVLPRLGMLTVILVIYAVFNLYCDLSGNELLPYPLGFIPLAAVLAVLIWYLVSTVKANKRFF